MIRVCSGFSPSGRVQYGDRFLSSFDHYWPKEVDLKVWVEEDMPMPRGAYRDLWSIPGATAVRDLTANPLMSGRQATEKWKPKCRQLGYNFRFDAAKFWKQILIPSAAAQDMDDGDTLVWLDADVVTIAPVPHNFPARLLKVADLCFLGREPKHSEIGFWAVVISPDTRFFLETIANFYRSGEFAELKEWHSAFVWDHVRRSFEAGGRLVSRNLCSPGARGHVWPQTELSIYTRHDKGPRKPRG